MDIREICCRRFATGGEKDKLRRLKSMCMMEFALRVCVWEREGEDNMPNRDFLRRERKGAEENGGTKKHKLTDLDSPKQCFYGIHGKLGNYIV